MVSNNPPPSSNNGRNPQDPRSHDGRRRFDGFHNAASPKPLKPTTPIAKSHDGDQFITEQPSLSQGPSDHPPSKPNSGPSATPEKPKKPNASPNASPKLRLVGQHPNTPSSPSKSPPVPPSRRTRNRAAELGFDYAARTPFGSSEPAASSIAATGVMLDLTPVGQPIAAASDPRWVLALRTAEALQGSVLPPEQRQKLIRLGKVMGMTAFDANLVIAIIQDQARRGYAADYCPTAGEPQLQMVPLPRLARAIHNFPGRRMLMLACAIAAVLATEIIFFKWWLGA